MHVPEKFRENTAMRFRVTVQKLNVTDGVAISPVPALGVVGDKNIKHFLHMVQCILEIWV